MLRRIGMYVFLGALFFSAFAWGGVMREALQVHTIGQNAAASSPGLSPAGWCCAGTSQSCYMRETAALCLRTDQGLAFSLSQTDCDAACATVQK